jgi:hypothetical protein
MENLERLSSSVAQVELLLASLKRENRDLSQRLAQSAHALRAGQDLQQVELALLKQQLHEASLSLRQDPGLEARAHQAELEAADLARQLDEARRRHLDEKGALEAEIQRLRSEALTGRFEEQLPIASESALREAQSLRETAETEAAILRQRISQVEHLAAQDRQAAEAAKEAEAQAQQALEAHRSRLAEQDKRITALEGHSLELERQWGEAQLHLAESAKPEEVAAWQARLALLESQASQAESVLAEVGRLETEKQALRRQRSEMAAYGRERQALRRKVEELVATLQSVRLG